MQIPKSESKKFSILCTFKMNFTEKNYLQYCTVYVNSTTQRCSNKIFKTFLIADFFICHRCQRHLWCTLSCEYLCEFSNKFETALMENSGAWRKLIHEKNLKSKIS